MRVRILLSSRYLFQIRFASYKSRAFCLLLVVDARDLVTMQRSTIRGNVADPGSLLTQCDKVAVISLV